jgi:hypothetical protein
MPPSLDKPHVPGGISETCLYNDHDACRNPRCACSCHHPEVNPNIPIPAEIAAGPEKACPKCGVKRPFAEVFCRIDGERLASLLCGVCGAGMEPADSFCWRCSAAKGTARTPANVLTTRSVMEPANPPNGSGKVEEPEVDYAQQVLRGLQQEMANDGQQGEQDKPQVVVEQPAGTQGSFRLVNKPNPNKIRGPVKSQPSVSQSVSQSPTSPTGVVQPIRVRLPIKP